MWYMRGMEHASLRQASMIHYAVLLMHALLQHVADSHLHLYCTPAPPILLHSCRQIPTFTSTRCMVNKVIPEVTSVQ